MKNLRSWFFRESRRVARRIRLEDALLGGRFAAYALYRLRFFAARTAASAVLHAARIILAFRIFRPGDFAALLAAEAAAALVGGFWWGSLETLRERVRELQEEGRPQAMAAEIGRWLSWTLRLAAVLAVVGAGGAVLRAVLARRAFSAADLLLASVPLRVGLELLVRCYHSGIYAIRRVYRPLAAVLLVETVGFGAVLGLWPILGSWALPAAAMVSSVLAAGILFRYTARAYRHYGLDPRPFIRWRRPRRPHAAGGAEWALAGAANALMRLDGLALLAVSAAVRSGASPLAVLLLAVGPLIRAAADWARLFYFDLKRQETVLLLDIKAVFARRITRLSLPIAFVLAAAAAVTAAVLYGGRALPSLPALSLFLTARSILAARQMRAFAERSYGLLIATGVGIASAWAAGALLITDPRFVLAAGAAVLLAAFPFLAPRRGASPANDGTPGGLLTLPDWIRSVRFHEGPGEVLFIRFSPGSVHRKRDDGREWAEDDRWSHDRIARSAAHRLGRRGWAALSGPAGILVFQKEGRTARLSKAGLLALGAGLIRSLQSTGPQPSGRAAAAAAAAYLLEKGALPEGSPSRDLERDFARFHSRGWILAPDRPVPQALAGLSSEERGTIFAEALDFAADFNGRPGRSRFEASARVEDGVIRALYVLGPTVPERRRARWREIVREANLRAAFFSRA